MNLYLGRENLSLEKGADVGVPKCQIPDVGAEPSVSWQDPLSEDAP